MRTVGAAIDDIAQRKPTNSNNNSIKQTGNKLQVVEPSEKTKTNQLLKRRQTKHKKKNAGTKLQGIHSRNETILQLVEALN